MSAPARASVSSSSFSSSSLDCRPPTKVGVAVIGHADLLDCLAARCNEKVATFNTQGQCQPEKLETLGTISSLFPATDAVTLSKLTDALLIDGLRSFLLADWLKTSKQRRADFGVGAPRWKGFLLAFAQLLPDLFGKVASDKDQRLLAVCEPPSLNKRGFKNLDVNLPSGKIDKGDNGDLIAAALRELSEECHLMIRPSELHELSVFGDNLPFVDFEDPAYASTYDRRHILRIYILQLQSHWKPKDIETVKLEKVIKIRNGNFHLFPDTEFVRLRKICLSTSAASSSSSTVSLAASKDEKKQASIASNSSNPYFCALCQVQMNSEQCFKDHLNGKNHDKQSKSSFHSRTSVSS